MDAAHVPDGYGLFLVTLLVLVFVLMLCCLGCTCPEDQPDPGAEAAEQMVARTLAEMEALAARAEAVLAEHAAALAPPPPPPLPYFPYAGQGGGASETVVCSICLEPLRQWQLCSEVPVCRHVFHRECLVEWARSNGSCPLCRAKIVPGSYGVAVADDMV